MCLMLVSLVIVIIEVIVSINQICDDVICLSIETLSKQICSLNIFVIIACCSLFFQRAFITKRQLALLRYLIETRSREVFITF